MNQRFNYSELLQLHFLFHQVNQWCDDDLTVEQSKSTPDITQPLDVIDRLDVKLTIAKLNQQLI